MKASVVAVVREQVKRLPRVEQRTPWRHPIPASCSADGGAFATRQRTTSASAADASVSRKRTHQGRRQRTRRECDKEIHRAGRHRCDCFRWSSLRLREKRGVHGGYCRGNGATSRHRQRFGHFRRSDGRHAAYDGLETSHEGDDHKEGANKADLLGQRAILSPVPSAVPDTLLAVSMRSLARASLLKCGHGLASAV